MKQVLQDLGTGQVILPEIPVPEVKPGHLLVQSVYSLVSLGTEKMLLEFGKASWLGRAQSRPDQVKQVIDRIRTDGLGPTLQAVKNRIDQPLPLGYSNVGRVIQVGSGVTQYRVGDRVVSNGPHAEVVCVPENLCALVPAGVDDVTAAFTVVAAVGLQGIRLLEPTLGETFVVLGLGLIGLLSVQILKANGCRVIGFDYDPGKVTLAEKFGAEAFTLIQGSPAQDQVKILTSGIGADGVLITAGTSKSDPVRWAPQMCRKRGRVILVGVSGLELSRDDFYEKEISFQVSCSYGPGRYDPHYEKKGVDYPIGYVRWTEQRNFQAILELMAEGRIVTQSLVTKVFPIEQAPSAYENLTDPSALGLVIQYSQPDLALKRVSLNARKPVPVASQADRPVIGLLGAGQFASGVLAPALLKAGARLKTVVSPGGLHGWHVGRKFSFEAASSDVEVVLQDPEIDTVVVATSHRSHGGLALEALLAGKNVFVEKPLATSEEELRSLDDFLRQNERPPLLTVGFNRRFSPHTERIRDLLSSRRGPLAMTYTVNAGPISVDHWIQDPDEGGGRLLGEGCHFVDFMRFIAANPIRQGWVQFAKSSPADTFSIQLAFEDGSIGTLHYYSNGHRSYPKERVEIFSEGRVLVLDNFLRLDGYGWAGFKKLKTSAQERGHKEEVSALIHALKGGPPPIPIAEIFEVSRLCLELSRGNSWFSA